MSEDKELKRLEEQLRYLEVKKRPIYIIKETEKDYEKKENSEYKSEKMYIK